MTAPAAPAAPLTVLANLAGRGRMARVIIGARRPQAWSRSRVRIVAVGAAVAFLGLALALRVLFDGAVEQNSGTALYASMVYAGVVFLWPRWRPVVAGAVAILFCWVVETAQLTGVPATLSAHSIVARLALGVQFDPRDLFWYPAGVVPIVIVDAWLRRTP